MMSLDLYGKYKNLLIEYDELKAKFDNNFNKSKQLDSLINIYELIDSVNAGIIIHSSYKIDYMNLPAMNMIGVESEKDILGKVIFEIIAPDSQSLTNIRIAKLLNGEKVPPVESFIIRQNTQENIPVLVSSSAITINDEIYVLSILTDISDLKKSELEYNAVKERLQSMYELSNLNEDNEDSLIRFVLEEAIKITHSEVGFFVFVNDDQLTLQLGIWSQSTVNYCTALYENHYPIHQAGLWAECIRTGKSMIVNDYETVANKGGLPTGHFPLKRFLSIPLIENGKNKAIVAIGNKANEYEEDDALQLSAFFHNMWNMIVKIRIEKQLKKSEALYKLIATNLPNSLVVLMSLNQKIIHIHCGRTNSNIEFMYQSLLEMEISNLLNTDDLLLFQELFDNAINKIDSNQTFRIEGGVYKFYFISLSTLDDEASSVLMIIQDMSEWEYNETKLLESEEKYRTLVERSIDGIIIVQDSHIVFANSKMQKLTGLKREQLIGKKYFDLYTDSEVSKVQGYYSNEGLSSLVPNVFETVLKSKNAPMPVEQNINQISYLGTPALFVTVRDIRERVKNRIIVQKMSLIAEQSPNSIMITNKTGEIEFVNLSFEEVTGYAKEEIYGLNPSILKSGNTKKSVYENMWATINSGKKWTGELLNRKKNGDLFWESIIIFSIKDENSKIVNFVAIKEDITEKKQAEQDLIQSNINLRMLNECYITLLNAETLNELYYSFCDIAINISGINSSVIFEVTPTDNDKLSISVIANSSVNEHDEVYDNIQHEYSINNCRVFKAIKDRQLEVCKANNQCGSCSWVLPFFKNCSKVTIPIKNEHYQNLQIMFIGEKKSEIPQEILYLLQELVNYLNFGLDIFHDKVAKSRIEELHIFEKEQLDVTLSSIGDGVIAIDRDNSITYINRAALKIMDKKIDECLNQSFFTAFEFYDEADKVVLYNPYDYLYVKLDDPLAKTRFTIKRNNGKMKYINISVNRIIDKNEAFIGIVIVLKDVTKIVKIEAQSTISQKMESVGQLAAGIAHEINTPMQFVGDNTFFTKESFESLIDFILRIKNYNFDDDNFNLLEFKQFVEELYETDDLEYLSTEVPIAIDRTLEGIDRVRKIVSAMKSFAHSSGKAKSKANINQGIEVTSSITRNEWKHRATLELVLAEDMPLVYCSIDEINQVVLNMIINSAHAISERMENDADYYGKIKIETKYDLDYAYIIIKDNGNGISPDKNNRVFDPFYTTKEIGKGTGQGLAIAHDIIVNKHKGVIELESEFGKWTKFIVKLPLAE